MRQITTVLVAVLGAALVLAAAAAAKDGDVLRAGTCTQASTSKLKLGPEDGAIEVEFEVDQNRNGVRWKVVVAAERRRRREPDAGDARPERLVRARARDAERLRHRQVRRPRHPRRRDVHRPRRDRVAD